MSNLLVRGSRWKRGMNSVPPKDPASEPRIENQELYCHDCGKYVQFRLDLSLNGNHVLKCPNCEHEHCRVVRNGRITGDRWDSRNGATYFMYAAGYTTSATTSYYMIDSWTSTA